jgi:hypothetical protein
MKKVLSVLVILGFVIGMAACGNKKAEEAARIADSIRVADSLALVAQAEAEALAAQEAAAAEEARIQDSIAAAAAAPAKKTTVQKTKEATPVVKEEAPKTKTLRGGGTSGN